MLKFLLDPEILGVIIYAALLTGGPVLIAGIMKVGDWIGTLRQRAIDKQAKCYDD